MLALHRIKSIGRRGWLGIFFAFLCLYLASAALIGLNRPPWGDEEHFVTTVRQFGNGISLDLLRTYGYETSTPLAFMVYALWGRLVGFSLPTLRIFSLVMAAATAILFWRLCYKIFDDAFAATLCSVFLMINPYIFGFSLFVFPDLFTILCLVVGMLAMVEEKPVLLGLACAAGLLSRQYFIFFPLAVFIYCAYGLWRKDAQQVKYLAAIALSVLPTLLLFWLWKGVSPQNGARELYLAYAFKFYPTAFVLYVILLGVYLAPLVVLRWRKYYLSLGTRLAAILASSIYFAYPIRAPAPSLNSGITTVGYLHRFLSAVLGGYVDIAFYALFVLSLPILFQIIRSWLKEIKKMGNGWWIRAGIVLFLVIMPFSYLWWEKYFVLVLPLVILEIYRPAPEPTA